MKYRFLGEYIDRASDLSSASMGRSWVDPRGTDLNQGGHGTVLAFPFFPAGKASCFLSETTSLDHGDIPTGFGRLLVSGISL